MKPNLDQLQYISHVPNQLTNPAGNASLNPKMKAPTPAVAVSPDAPFVIDTTLQNNDLADTGRP